MPSKPKPPTNYERGLRYAINACKHGRPGVHTVSTTSRRHPLQIAHQILAAAQSAIQLEIHHAAEDIKAHNYKHGVHGAKPPKGDQPDD